MRPRVHPAAAYAEIEEVARKRDELPTDDEIAQKYGMTRMYVSYLMLQARRRMPIPEHRQNVEIGPNGEFSIRLTSEAEGVEMAP